MAPTKSIEVKLPAVAFRKPGQKPRSQARWYPGDSGLVFLRDQLSLSSWLTVGALIQALLVLLPASKALVVLPTLGLAAYKVLQAIILVSTYKPGDDGAILAKVGATMEKDIKSDGKICLLVLGARSYHPLGVFAPGLQELGAFQQKMATDLEINSEDYGFLGYNNYLSTDGGQRSNQVMGHYYFRNYEGLHKFAHSKTHRDGWDWWNQTIKEHPHIGILHETYEAPEGSWEAIYINFKPSGIGATVFPYQTEEGIHEYRTPMENASVGRLRTSKGRMRRTSGDDNDAYGEMKQYSLGF